MFGRNRLGGGACHGSQAVAVGPRRLCLSKKDFGLFTSKEEVAMKNFKSIIGRFVRDENGTETLEWGLVCGLLVIGAITAITLIGPKVTAMWNNVNNQIPAQP